MATARLTAGDRANSRLLSSVENCGSLSSSVVAPALLLQPCRLAQHGVGHAALVGQHALQQGGVRGGQHTHLGRQGEGEREGRGSKGVSGWVVSSC